MVDEMLEDTWRPTEFRDPDKGLDAAGVDGVAGGLSTLGALHQECVSVPENSVEIKTATKWGGARAGAGRRRVVGGGSVILPQLGVRWYCVQTWPRREADVVDRLARDGWVVRVAQHRPDGVAELVFPGYVFCEFDAAERTWPLIARVEGVQQLIRASTGWPVPFPVGEVEGLLAWFAPGGGGWEAGKPVVAAPIPVGTAVVVSFGAVVGMDGVVEASDGRRARVRVTLLGREVVVSVAQGALAMAAG